MADEQPEQTSGERVNVINPFGRLVSVPAADAEGALASGGYARPTAEQLQQYQDEQSYGGAAGQVGAVGLGALRGVTAGLSDKALVEMARLERGDEGASRMADKLSAISEVNPTLSTVGEIGGYAGGGALMGTAKLGAKAALLAGGGTRGAMAAAAATGATEGAVMGFGTEVSAATLEQRELDGEQLVASIGWGAVTGGAFGGALALGGAGVRAGKAKLLAAMRRGGGDIGEQIGAKASRAWAGTAEGFGVENASAIERFSPLTKTGREAFDVVQAAPELLTKQARALADGAEGMMDHMWQMRKRFSGTAKRAQMSRAISRETGEAAIAASRAELSAIRRDIDKLAGAHLIKPGRGATAAEKRAHKLAVETHKGAYGLKSQTRKMRQRILAAQKAVDGHTDPLDSLMRLDELKRSMGRLTTEGLDPATLASSDLAARSRYTKLYDRLKTHLEREDLFGNAAKIQSGINEKWYQFFETQRTTEFNKIFVKRVQARGPFGGTREAVDKDKLYQALLPPKLTGGPDDIIRIEQHEVAKEAMRQWTGSADRLLGTADAALGKNTKALVGGFRSNARGLKSAMGELDRISSLQQDWQALGAGTIGAMPAAATGFALGALGPAAAPVAMLGSAIADPKRAIRQVYAVRELGGKAALVAAKAGSKLRRAAPVIRVATVHSAMDARRRDRLERAAKAAAEVNPTDVEQRAHERFAGVSPGAPQAVEAAVSTAVRGATYLAQQAPKRRGRPDVPGNPYLAPSDHELEIFDRRRRTVQRPLSVVQAVTDGSITREAVEALDAVYPRLAADTRSAYQEELTRLAERGEQLPYPQARALEVLLGQPLVGINHHETVTAIQAVYTRTAPQPPKPRQQQGAPEVAGMYDRNDSLERELAS